MIFLNNKVFCWTLTLIEDSVSGRGGEDSVESVCRHNSMPFDEGRKCSTFLVIKTQGTHRTWYNIAVGRGGKSLLCGPGSELRTTAALYIPLVL